VAAEALEKSVLESKDKEQLFAIAQALGIKTTARAAKATLIDKILESTRGAGDGEAPAVANGHAPPDTDAAQNGTPAAPPVAARRGKVASNGASSEPGAAIEADAVAAIEDDSPPQNGDTAPAPTVILGADGEPLADWEIELINAGEMPAPVAPPPSDRNDRNDDGDDDGQGDGESRNSRRRRRRRSKGGGGQAGDRFEPRPANVGANVNGMDRDRDRDRGPRPDRPEFDREPADSMAQEPVKVEGYLDLRDEGYGFLRVHGYLASRDDAYIPVKLTRQFGLRKGDHVTGLSRPAGRNEKNPAMLEIHTVNGKDPELARDRPRFEDLTALFPDERLKLENPSDPNNMTARIIDLISPIGKGQRAIIVSPPKAGKTTIMKTIATSIERNHPEVKLMVLLIDERPEEVTDMRRTVQGEVISSTFDRPSEEHTHVAELAIEKAKRMVEMGEDVVIILDGITRLSRAYNLAAPASGRILSGGIDAGALYPPKKFFGAARNIEEGGSLTILATALVETNSRMDDAIFEEFKGTGNMELRLDRKLAERRIYPAIDVDASSTRHEELLFDRKQLQMVWKLRRVLSGLAADGNAAPGLELLVDRLKTFKNNDDFLNEISKQQT
jgi:transcription termination factor Rho